MGERERKCLASRRRALLVPLSTSSKKKKIEMRNQNIIINLTLQEQGQKRNDKHQKDGHDTPPNPIKDRNEMVASLLADNHIAPRVHFTNSQLFVQCTDIEHL